MQKRESTGHTIMKQAFTMMKRLWNWWPKKTGSSSKNMDMLHPAYEKEV
jgi:hypothetical protein